MLNQIIKMVILYNKVSFVNICNTLTNMNQQCTIYFIAFINSVGESYF